LLTHPNAPIERTVSATHGAPRHISFLMFIVRRCYAFKATPNPRAAGSSHLQLQ
jgi:hypothetical protein